MAFAVHNSLIRVLSIIAVHRTTIRKSDGHGISRSPGHALLLESVFQRSWDLMSAQSRRLRLREAQAWKSRFTWRSVLSIVWTNVHLMDNTQIYPETG
jgi:hypothetical protein